MGPRHILPLVLICLAAGAGAGRAEGVGTAELEAHAACATAGEESGVCAGILTTYCLNTASDVATLSDCRAAFALALEERSAALTKTLTERGAGGQAREIAAGAHRIVADFCAELGRRQAAPDTLAHDSRCAMMEAHVTVYHLIRALAETEQKT